MLWSIIGDSGFVVSSVVPSTQALLSFHILTGKMETRPARQALIEFALVAYQRPLYQVLALDRDALRPAAERPPLSGDDEPVDLKAVFVRIWEVLA